ncbi:MAG: hypothetical protein WA364_02040 [Candidatus Nitrosopolaris sp.]
MGRGGDVAVIDIVFELAQVAYIVITAVILAKKKNGRSRRTADAK